MPCAEQSARETPMPERETARLQSWQPNAPARAPAACGHLARSPWTICFASVWECCLSLILLVLFRAKYVRTSKTLPYEAAINLARQDCLRCRGSAWRTFLRGWNYVPIQLWQRLNIKQKLLNLVYQLKLPN